jgi:hypothetical protein
MIVEVEIKIQTLRSLRHTIILLFEILQRNHHRGGNRHSAR